MSKAIKVIAILALIVTIAGALVVLYGVNTLVPQAVQVSVAATPAAQAQDTFDAVMDQVAQGTFHGRILSETGGVTADQAAFLTYTVRLHNKGFFPAEWISVACAPREDVSSDTRDLLQLDNYGANVLAGGSQGDIAATVLTTIDPQKTAALLEVTCYVLGEKKVFQVDVD